MKLKIEITERKFKGFIKDGRLTKPKTYIAKYFGIHVQTLRSWMKREGYGHLIGVMRGRPDKPKKEPIPPKEIDGVKHLTCPGSILFHK